MGVYSDVGGDLIEGAGCVAECRRAGGHGVQV